MTIVCEDCNKVDAKAKNLYRRRFGTNPRDAWSFSVDEISSVITVRPHAEHDIKTEKALLLAHQLQTMFFVRQNN